jgi:hypothetical protein
MNAHPSVILGVLRRFSVEIPDLLSDYVYVRDGLFAKIARLFRLSSETQKPLAKMIL